MQQIRNLLDTIENVFGDRVTLCNGCELCTSKIITINVDSSN